MKKIDAGVANAFTEQKADNSLQSPNSSFPLSESQIPDTFDPSFDATEISDFFAIPGSESLYIADEDKEGSLPVEASIDPASPGSSLNPVVARIVEAPQNDRPNEQVPLATNIELENLSMAEQFSRVESTISDILSSPIPTHFGMMDSIRGTISTDDVQNNVPSVPSMTHKQEMKNSESFNSVELTAGTEGPRSSTPRLPEEIYLVVTTYADATNLAMQYPELAEEILTLPLPTPPKPVSEACLIGPQRHYLRNRTCQRLKAGMALVRLASPDSAIVVKPKMAITRAHLLRILTLTSLVHPMYLGAVALAQDPKKETETASETAFNETSAGSSQTTGEWGFSSAQYMSAWVASSGRSDDDADHEMLATPSPVRLGWHTSPTIFNREPQESMSRVHKQQVANPNTTARKHLCGSDRGDRRKSLSTSSERSFEEPAETSAALPPFIRTIRQVEIPGENLEERFHRLGSSFPSGHEINAGDEEATPVLRSGQSPCREIQPRTNNSPYQGSPKIFTDTQTPRMSSFSNSKSRMSPSFVSLASQENHPLGNSDSEWLPPQHTIEDWLNSAPASRPIQQGTLPLATKTLRIVNASQANEFLSKSTSDRQVHIQNPFGIGPQVQDAAVNWFGNPVFTPSDPSRPGAGLEKGANDVVDARPQQRRSARQSLPPQSELFSQHLAKGYVNAATIDE
ncbi:hypothetical protein H0H81_011586 [Sphagnurus paluster]|uniref:Uncharacterized protein n=1 Tax=Sphagnurus paluster TaxID=117069 RepID=A0A9P7KJ42_9AGAR|nr:hypothetical protein H0H81_011586 [Sphagnurus paluster]